MPQAEHQTDDPPSRPTLVVLVHGAERYGVLTVNQCIVTELTKRGWHVVVFALGKGPFASECEGRGLRVEYSRAGPVPGVRGTPIRRLSAIVRNWRHSAKVADELVHLLRDVGGDAVFFSWPSHAGIVARTGAQLGHPSFWHMPNALGTHYPFGLNRRIYQHLCAKGHIVPLANSAYTAATLGGTKVQPVVFHLAVDAARFDPAKTQPVARRQLGLPDDALVAGIVSRITPLKGQARVLHAIAMLGDEAEQLHLILLGDADDASFVESINQFARTHGLAKRLHMPGRVSDPERYYGMMDLSINSRVDPEPFGLSVIESMIMKTPVLAHALGGPAETIVDGQTGWLVHDPSVATFAEGLRRALADRPHWGEMGAAAHRHAVAHFTSSVYVERFIELAAKYHVGRT
jgi:glycosyltransferase involved in cell wall biosynthesis